MQRGTLYPGGGRMTTAGNFKMALIFAAVIPLIAAQSGRGVGSADRAGQSNTLTDENPQGVWLRRFEPPQRELPITLIPVGNLFAVWTPTLGLLKNPVDLPLHLATRCDVVTRIEPALYGFSIEYLVTNRKNVAVELPVLQLPGNALQARIQHLDHRRGCTWEILDATDGELISIRKELYPQSLYAPSIIMRDTRFAVGLSLEYDIMDYRHQIRASVFRGASGSSYGDDWTARFFLDGTIAPGRSRTYRLHVWYNEPGDWIHTLRPYRAFLWSTYGQVRYPQDMRPVWTSQLSDTLLLSEQNPRGFKANRADLNGFERDVTEILEFVVPAGYHRVTIYTPAGVYLENRHNNFPPQFTTEWTDPMAATADEWKRLPNSGVNLYFWWGRSAQVADRWDDDELDWFDTTVKWQAERMMLEWDNAIALGAKGLGLDKFTPLMPWQALDWLDKMRSHKPDAYFMGEPTAYDILHLHIPTYILSSDVPSPHYLADYLAPGRELWVFLVGGDGSLERARELISWGHTIMTTTRNFTANDLLDAIRRAQRGDPYPAP